MKVFSKIAGVVLMFVVSFGILPAGAETSPENVVSVNPIGFAFGVANVEWEKRLQPDLSIAPSLLYAGYGDWSIYGIGVTAKKYAEATAPKGWWYGGNAGILQVSWTETELYYTGFIPNWREVTKSTMGFSIGAVTGYKWLYEGGFTVEPSVGLSYYSAGEAAINGVGVGLGLQVGKAF